MPHHHCCIPGCRSDSRYSKLDCSVVAPLRFFCIPSLTSKHALHNQWLQNIRRPDLRVSRNTRVCSLHFVDGKPTKENPLPTQILDCHQVRRARTNRLKAIKGSSDHLTHDDSSQPPFNNQDPNGALTKSCLPFYYRQNYSSSAYEDFNKALLEHCKQSLSSSADEEGEDDSSQMEILPETIIHEYKQTQTDGAFAGSLLNAESQTEFLVNSNRQPLMHREGEANCLRCQAPLITEANFAIKLLKLDEGKMLYYTGLVCYDDFKLFLNELKPCLDLKQRKLDENRGLSHLSLEDELLIAMAAKRRHLLAQDLAYRCGQPLQRVEKIVTHWSPILDRHQSKPWLAQN